MGRPWWQTAGKALINPLGTAGDMLGGTAGKIVNGVNVVANPWGAAAGAGADFVGRNWDEIKYASTDPLGHLSGGDKIDSALKDQQAYNDKGISQLGQSYGEARGLLAPYQQGGAQDYQGLRDRVQGGAFNPQYQGYQGLMSGGISNPMFRGPESGQVNPQFQGMDSVNPQFQGYQGPMSSGQQAPQYQQYGGQTDFQAQARPERQAGTTENVNMFMDPGYKFRLEQGLGAVQSSAAARGLLGSSATLQGINDYAQNAASQEFGNAYGRMQQAQNNRQMDFESDRGFGQNNFGQNFARSYGMNQDANNYGMNAAAFNQNAFQGDRAAGMQYAGMQNDFGQQNASRGLQYTGMQNDFNQQNAGRGLQYAGMQNDFNQQNASRGLQSNQFDMNFGYGMNQDLNNWNQADAASRYNQWNNMAGMGYNAAGQGANLATGYGQNLSEMYAGQGNAAAAAAMAKANARNGIIGQGAGLLGGLMGG